MNDSNNSKAAPSKKVTSLDVAKRAGVSKWTVSRAFTEGASISPLARDKVLKAAEELGYRPNLLARSLSKNKTNIVGLIIDELNNPFLADILDRMMTKLQSFGILSMVLNITDDQRTSHIISLAEQYQVDALIFCGTSLDSVVVKLANEEHHIPLLVFMRDSDNTDLQVINTDNIHAGREMGKILLDQGYTRFGYVAGPKSSNTKLKRMQGYIDILAEHNLCIDVMLSASHYQRELGFQTTKAYLESTAPDDRVDALIFENDILAIGGLDALKAFDLEGKIAIVGFDNIDLARSPHYELTTFEQPLEGGLNLLVKSIRSDRHADIEQKQFLEGRPVLRRSHLRY